MPIRRSTPEGAAPKGKEEMRAERCGAERSRSRSKEPPLPRSPVRTTRVSGVDDRQQSGVEEAKGDDKAEPSRRAQRQSEQRDSRSGGEADSRWKMDGEEKKDWL